LDILKPLTAFIGTFYVGTERLGRALTREESKALDAVLRKYDFIGASLIALSFALKLRRGNRDAAEDLRGRANLRLVRLGWDPMVIALVRRLCRYVWSEHTNERRESATTRKAEEGFLHEQGVHVGTAYASPEDEAVSIQQEREDEEKNEAQYEALRAALVEAKDEVNLLWLEYTLADVTDPEEMARKSGRDVKEFYNAKARRNRIVAQLAPMRGPGGGKKKP
jgi:hypothetical protein